MRVFLLLIAVVLTCALILAARYGLADVYARPARNYLQDKRGESVTLTETEWQAIHANLRQALSLAPSDPVTLTELGRLHRIQLESDTLESTEIERHGETAIDYYEQAAILRPTWPWGWSSLAEVRYELYQDAGNAYHQALVHAAHFGPWEGRVQRLIAEFGLDTWPSLSPGAKQAVLGTIDRALERYPSMIDTVVDAAQDWPILCMAATTVAAPEAHGLRPDDLSRLRRHCDGLAVD